MRVTIPLHESIVYALIAAPAVQLFKRASSTMTSIRVRRYEAEDSVRLGYADRDRWDMHPFALQSWSIAAIESGRVR